MPGVDPKHNKSYLAKFEVNPKQMTTPPIVSSIIPVAYLPRYIIISNEKCLCSSFSPLFKGYLSSNLPYFDPELKHV